MDFGYDPPEQFRTASDRAHEIVAAELGHDDFGPGDYLPGLKVMLQSMDYDPHFTGRGRRAAWGQIVGVLRSRAGAFRAMKDNPGFDAVAIASPVVITGIPRTGTTALHRLMAVDPRFQGLQTWLLDAPMPRPPVEQWENYPEFRKSLALIEARYAVAPQKRAAHHVAAEEVHECCMLLRHSFVSNLWNCGWSAATYDAWWQCQSEAPAYDYYRQCVQLIGMNDRDKRWLLKNPGHIDNLDLLFAVFPDAKVIQTHRDPAKAIPSLVSLLMASHPTIEQDRADQRAAIMLEREVAKWANAVRKAEAVRSRHPGQVLDVVHRDFHRQPMDVLERIYDFIGMEIPDTTRAGFARRIEEKPELQHGVHRYAIADYGMTEEQARAPFGDYIQRFDLVEKAK
ncbi:sulfotransferase family protein [Novosphingobium sp. PhB165]|uniref:sulfotransferase family protein n=1 Tax=Novosphingobium sp. PhB165 TaxID=2485105 RepID=UPI00104ECDDC|nr:sulfotransferase [Novosphingobium sp. PhB165]TCM16093.1 sulfotransferase family protein [Novosphingobium sp. PhB165]